MFNISNKLMNMLYKITKKPDSNAVIFEKKNTNKTLNTCTRYAGQAVGQLLNSTKHTSTFSNTHNI